MTKHAKTGFSKQVDEQCNACDQQLNTWDIKIAKAVGYTQSFPCERCMAKEYDMTVEELRDYFEDHFGMRPCKGI